MVAWESSATVRSPWPGLAGLKHLVIFGDSYSSVGWKDTTYPTPQLPLGIQWPGETYADFSQSPNWVGHLIKSPSASHLLVYDYAIGGSTTSGVEYQINKAFLQGVGLKPDWAPWRGDDTLFVTWVGVNDVCYPWKDEEREKRMEQLFSEHDVLYQEHGARNFMFINVPPRAYDSTKKPTAIQEAHANRISSWNLALSKKVSAFTERNTEATVLLFSAFTTFANVLSDPVKYDFLKEDTKTYSGIWSDHVHPSGKMHAIVSKDVEAFLTRVKKMEGQ